MTLPKLAVKRPVSVLMCVLCLLVFGVSSISDDGYESPVVFPGPAGAFVSVGDPPAPAAR